MKRRLRKKLHLKEFQTFGFEVNMKTNIDRLDGEGEDLFLDDLIYFIESVGLAMGGGLSGFYVISEKRHKNVTEEDRMTVTKWLSNNDKVIEFEVCGLTDSWYGKLQDE